MTRFNAALPIAALALSLAAVPASAAPVNWTDWQAFSTGGGSSTVAGQLTVGATTVDVTFDGAFAFAQLGTGTNYWAHNPGLGGSPYTNSGANAVDNAPTASEMIALAAAGTFTLTFSQAIDGLVLSFISLNGPSWTFDQDFSILSVSGQNIDGAGTDAPGYWGSGSVTKTVAGSNYTLSGSGEPHGSIMFLNPITTLTFSNNGFENWRGFTVGVQGLAVAPVPVPAAGLLLLGALGMLGGVSRFRRA